MRAWKQTGRLLVLCAILTVAVPVTALAAQSSSSNYQVNEVFFGSGGELNACSGSYCAKQSAGELVVGNTSSANYQAQGGFNTDRAAYIECIVGAANINLGTLTATSTKTATIAFSVKAYLSQGYTVVNASDPPRNTSHIMQAIGIPAASVAGSEQFGINLAANTDPTTFGAAPVHVPDATFSNGQVAADYSSSNLYKYAKNDTIAYSTASSSFTNYTISYVFNISNLTPGGDYNMQHVLVATATY